MNSEIRRIYVEKKTGFDVEAQNLLKDLKSNLGISGINNLRLLNRYDICGVSEEEYILSREIIFSEKTVDKVYEEEISTNKEEKVFAVEYLPGQYDQRADSACQCISIITQREEVVVNSSKVVILSGEITEIAFKKIKSYIINSVDSKEALLEKPFKLQGDIKAPSDIEVIKDFINFTKDNLERFRVLRGLAMTLEDLSFCQHYFKHKENRNPSITEIKVIDTYWSDHCRHTTFMSEITEVHIKEGKYNKPVKKAYIDYLEARKYVYGENEKPVCLMDIATIGMKELRKRGLLQDLDLSDEINACSIEIDVAVNNCIEKWLLLFKNETHNHPTEIEPFGGAATCIGGAIRDPLSGRAYVYQAMRVTGSGDPRKSLEETLIGKLTQRKITLGAAEGYSSYGNQIGLATGQVTEIYDEGFVAKRMEIGAVIGAVPKSNVIRETPMAGDVVLLIGGRTGRDGCGGAAGSSREHNEESILNCGAEVQKGNAVIERKIQRLFRNPNFSKLIKKCNDFGAGGVSVAIGELTEGLEIDLDLIPKKYMGLDGTELAISESQERMAIVVSKENLEKAIAMAKEENVEATQVAIVTADKRLKMSWRESFIVDLSRQFLDTNGVRGTAAVIVNAPSDRETYFNYLPKTIEENLGTIKKAWLENLKRLQVCSQRGLCERFDSTIGAGTIVMPFGGKYQATPAEGMAAKIPVLHGETNTVSIMTFGYNPKIAKWSPFHGALYSIVEAAAKISAMGGDYKKIRLSLQEYFERLGENSEKWGKPFSALLGALYAQRELNIPAIGGKDSMSGTFKDLNVPPTLTTFGVCIEDSEYIISPEFKNANSRVVLLKTTSDEEVVPNFDLLRKNLDKVKELIDKHKILSAMSVKDGGISEAVSKMCFGNRIGMRFISEIDTRSLFQPLYGSIILEIDSKHELKELFKDTSFELLGYTQQQNLIEVNNEKISINEAYAVYEEPLEKIFSTKMPGLNKEIANVEYKKTFTKGPAIGLASPKIFIPIFPGTNCEYDTQRAFERAGGTVNSFVFKNLTSNDIKEGIDEITKLINSSQIIMLPGGFSAGDEPDGSGKFIAAVFRNERVKEAVMNLLKNRDGLMLGICNGFQALIKLGLVPYGEITELKEDSPTLTYNNIGRHVSCMVRTKVVSKLSPWFNNVELGDIHTLPVSHGEGRFAASYKMVNKLIDKGQIAAQYIDFNGDATYNIAHNPNGSYYAVEALTSPDGRILGKMAHSERIGTGLYKNIPGEKDQKLFEAGVNYFK